MRLIKRLKGRINRGLQYLQGFRKACKVLGERARFERWRKAFTQSECELLIGPNLDASGGVRNHIHAIKRYTSLSCEMVPDERTLRRLGPEFFLANPQLFLDTPPGNSTRVLHSHVSPFFIDWCRQYRKQRDVRWVHTHHLLYYADTEIFGLPAWQREYNEAGVGALRDCDLPLVVSRSQQRELRRMFGVEAIYLPNGVDVAACDGGRANRFRARFQIAGPFVLWMGRNERVKNPREFLLAATSLPGLPFVMAGHQCSRESLEQQTGIAVPSNVRLTGPLPRGLAQDALAACSLLVVTSVREGLPTLVLEALAHRCRVISSDAEGCLDATDDGRLATIYRRGDVSSLCECIEQMIQVATPNEIGRAYVVEKFDWRVVVKNLDKYYRGQNH